MVDDVNFKESESNRESSSSKLSNQIGWVTFDESDNKESKCNHCVAEEKVSARNGQYISRLERELQRLQEKKRKPLSSKDMIKTLQEAKDIHMKQLMDKTEQSEVFLTGEGERNENSCCFPLYRAVFPKQPLSNEELECLVEDENDKDNGTVT